ncbi:MAG: CpaF family protein [Pseudomonadota bacterium]|nr:CpaF family protein [Pseudomonadota bacterium]
MDQSTRLFASRMLTEHFSCIQHYMRDPLVEEIMVNGENRVWVIRCGQGMVHAAEVRITQDQILGIITLLAHLDGKRIKPGTRHCILDSQMEGFRFAAVLSPVSKPGHSLCIRKHSEFEKSIVQLTNAGLFDPVLSDGTGAAICPGFSEGRLQWGGAVWADFFSWLVSNRRNIFLVGAPGCGKTTLLNALIQLVSPTERVITIEDTREIRLKLPNYVSFEASRSWDLSIQDLVVVSLRYRPSRLVVGEVRSIEAYEMLAAMNTGLSGCMASFHANSAVEALFRLERMAQGHPAFPGLSAFQADLARARPCIVHLCEGPDKVRRVTQVIEINAFDAQEKQYGFKTLFNGYPATGASSHVA